MRYERFVRWVAVGLPLLLVGQAIYWLIQNWHVTSDDPTRLAVFWGRWVLAGPISLSVAALPLCVRSWRRDEGSALRAVALAAGIVVVVHATMGTAWLWHTSIGKGLARTVQRCTIVGLMELAPLGVMAAAYWWAIRARSHALSDMDAAGVRRSVALTRAIFFGLGVHLVLYTYSYLMLPAVVQIARHWLHGEPITALGVGSRFIDQAWLVFWLASQVVLLLGPLFMSRSLFRATRVTIVVLLVWWTMELSSVPIVLSHPAGGFRALLREVNGLGVIVLMSVITWYNWPLMRAGFRGFAGLHLPFCPRCGYSRQGTAADRCPECGRQWA